MSSRAATRTELREFAELRNWLATADPGPLVVSTSGSTGEPKRVLLSRAAALASVEATATRLGGHGGWILALPMTGVAGLMVAVRSLVAGHEPIALGRSGWAAAVDALPDGRRYASLVPTQLHRAMDTADATALARLDAVLVGGAGIDPALLRAAADAGITMVRTYGMTETCGGCVYDGVPLDGVDVRVVDGLVEIAGPVLFDGYAGQPPREGEWFRTADLGKVEDGVLTVLGRADDVVISGGVNVPTRAVVALLRAVPGVRDVEVLGVPDDDWGERVVAFVVGDVALETLRAAVQPREWAPRQVVHLAALPQMPNGKVDRVALRGLA